MMSSLCTRRGFKDTAALSYNLQLEQNAVEEQNDDDDFLSVREKNFDTLSSYFENHTNLHNTKIENRDCETVIV